MVLDKNTRKMYSVMHPDPLVIWDKSLVYSQNQTSIVL